jgi:hypothetical protein
VKLDSLKLPVDFASCPIDVTHSRAVLVLELLLEQLVCNSSQDGIDVAVLLIMRASPLSNRTVLQLADFFGCKKLVDSMKRFLKQCAIHSYEEPRQMRESLPPGPFGRPYGGCAPSKPNPSESHCAWVRTFHKAL